MSLDSNEEELSGLDWEAEKAYIVATSPRSNAPTASQDSDEFSWDMDTVPVNEKPEVSNYSISQQTQQCVVVTNHHESPIASSNEEATTGSGNADTPVRPLDEITEKEISSQHCSDVQEEVIHFTSSLRPPSPKAPPSNNSLQTHSSAATHMQPQQATKLVHNASAHTLVICGPPGLGRGTLVQKLVYRSPQRFSLVVSHTTRSPRLHETYARDFYFVSRSEMLRSISRGKFIEYVQVDSDRVHPNKSYSPAVVRSRSTSPSSPSPSTSSSSNTGDLFGTTWDAFYEAQYSGKPSIVLNVTGKGAEQLKNAGIQGHYVCLQHSSDELNYSFVPDNVIHVDSSEECFHDLEEYALSLLSSCIDPDSVEEQLQWERVPTIQLQASTNKQSPALKTRKKQLSQSLVSYSELLTHFQNADLSTQLATIRPENRLSGLDRLLPPPRVSKKLHRERDMVFAIALCHFSDNNTIHTRTLHTVYCKLTGETTCQRFGPHWEDIGFQGSDPVDDLRGVGMLGLVQLVWLLENPNTLPVAQEVFRWIRDNVPFCVLSLNITSLALATLREGGLSRECNRREQVFAVLNDFYAAVLLSFSHSWRHKKRGFMESGLVLQEVGTFARKHARYLIREFEQNLKERHQRKSLSNTGRGVLAVQPAVRFTPLDELTSST